MAYGGDAVKIELMEVTVMHLDDMLIFWSVMQNYQKIGNEEINFYIIIYVCRRLK